MHGIVSITLHEPDYKTIFEQQVKHYAQKVRLKGFRVGAVPLALVRKMHGSAILAQELHKIASMALQDYLRKEAISIFTEPLLVTLPEEFTQQESFTFAYEIGLMDIDSVSLGTHISVTEFEIESVEDKLVNELIEGLQLVHGQAIPLEKSDGHAILHGNLTDSTGKQQLTVRIAIARIPNHLSVPFIGCQVGDQITVTQEMLAAHFPALLGLTFNVFAAFSKYPSAWPAVFTIDTIVHIMPAALEPALFDLVLGKGLVDSEGAFREMIAKVLLLDKKAEARYLFYEALRTELFKYNQITLPEAFLKKWLLAHNPAATAEEITHYYETQEEDLKFELLLGSIVRKNNLVVTQSDVVNEAKRIYTDYAAQSLKDVEEKITDIQSGILSFLQKDKGAPYARLHEKLSRDRAIDFIRQHISIVRHAVTAAQFDTSAGLSMNE